MKTVTFPPTLLDKIFYVWLKRNGFVDSIWVNEESVYYRHWSYRHRQRDFESWVFSQGGSVRRRNKQYYIEFTDQKLASIFLLRWS